MNNKFSMYFQNYQRFYPSGCLLRKVVVNKSWVRPLRGYNDFFQWCLQKRYSKGRLCLLAEALPLERELKVLEISLGWSSVVIDGDSRFLIKMLAPEIVESQQVFVIFFACMVLSMLVCSGFATTGHNCAAHLSQVHYQLGGFFLEKIPSFLGYSQTL